MGNELKIHEIAVLNGQVYTVGVAAFDGGSPVEKIIFNRPDACYNKGFQVTGATYLVTFEGSEIRRVIPFHAVADVGITLTKKEEPANEVPDLPGD